MRQLKICFKILTILLALTIAVKSDDDLESLMERVKALEEAYNEQKVLMKDTATKQEINLKQLEERTTRLEREDPEGTLYQSCSELERLGGQERASSHAKSYLDFGLKNSFFTEVNFNAPSMGKLKDPYRAYMVEV